MRTISFNQNIMPDGSMNAADVDPIWLWPQPLPSNLILTKEDAAPRAGRALRLTRTTVDPPDGEALPIFSPYFSGYRYNNQSLPYDGPPLILDFNFWVRTDGVCAIVLYFLQQNLSPTIITITAVTAWTNVIIPAQTMSTQAPFSDPKGMIQIPIEIQLGGIGVWAEITDMVVRQHNPGISAKERSCWNCDKFEPLDPAVLRGGVCRAAPPRRRNDSGCSTYWENPVFGPKPCPAGIKGDASFNWCQAWKRSAQPVPALPPQNPIP